MKVSEFFIYDQIDVVETEAIAVSGVKFVSRINLWRQIGYNSGVRGTDTSLSTLKRTKRKILDTETTAKRCKNIVGFFAATVPDESRAVVPLVPEAVAAPAVPEVIYDEDFYFDILDLYDILGVEKEDAEEVQPPKNTMESATENLMKVEAKIEKKSFLQTYQRIQGLALLNYFQLVIDG